MFADVSRVFRRIARRPPARFRPSFDPYTYTHGRWLDRNGERQKQRILHFDFDALLDLAVKCSPGARHVTDCEKREGGSNRVFMIHLDNGKTVVARLPTRIAGPPRLTVSSEVATLQFVRERTSIPVPSVLSWSSEPDNAIGSEYLIMDAMPGVPLKDVWNTMTVSQHIHCIKSLGLLCVKLWELSFPSYGSLYLSDKSPRGAVPLDDTFSIGPLCTSHLWGYHTLETRDVETPTGSVGPWHSLEAYLSGLLSRAESFLLVAGDQKHGSHVLYSVEAHTALLDIIRRSLKVIIEIGGVEDASSPTLFHPDLHTRNIFVDSEDPTKITGIIDWQSAAIEPSFMLDAERPDFAQELPSTESSHDEPNAEANEASPQAKSNAKANGLSPQAKARIDAEYCAKVWSVAMHICPKSRAVYDLDRLLVLFLAAGSAGWLKDAAAMRQCLLGLDQNWDHFKLPGKSFYQPTENEAEELKRQMDEVTTIERLRERLVRLLGCETDGWVPIERWEKVLPLYREEYRRFMDCADKDDAKLWPFDQR